MKTMKRINKEGKEEGRKKRKKQRKQEMKKMNEALIIHASTLFFVFFFLGAAPWPRTPLHLWDFWSSSLGRLHEKLHSVPCLDRFLDPSVLTGSRWMHGPHACNEFAAELCFCRFRCFCCFFCVFAHRYPHHQPYQPGSGNNTNGKIVTFVNFCVYVALFLTLCLSLCAIHTNPVSCWNSHWIF